MDGRPADRGVRQQCGLGLTTGDLTALVTYAMQILMAMMMLSMIFVMCIISQASAERICQVLNEESTVTNPENPVMEVKNGEIDFNHVTFRYSATSEKPVLDDIDLKIRSGMTVGIVGGTGSAKSSLVQLVPRLYDVTEGSLKVGGVDVRDYDLEVLRDQVAWYCRRTCCSPEPLPKTCVGAIRTPLVKRFVTHASLRRPTLHSGIPRQVRYVHRTGGTNVPAVSASVLCMRVRC